MPRKFSVAAPQRTRRRTPGAGVPLVSALEEATPRTVRVPTDAPCQVAIYKVTDVASDAWSSLEGESPAALWQVQIKHEARPFSVTYKIKETFTEFLKQKHKEDFL